MPGERKYLPYHLTVKEQEDSILRHHISHMVHAIEEKACPPSARKPDGHYDYNKCRVNPVAVARAKLEQ